jgi:alpha-N-arabinofuranosidase
LAFRFHGEGEGSAGLCVFQNQHHFASLGLSRRDGETSVLSRVVLNEVVMEKDHGQLPADFAEWEIQAEPFWYRLGFRDAEGRFRELDRIEARFLSTEVSGRFTGVFFALYALGSGKLECSRFGLESMPMG